MSSHFNKLKKNFNNICKVRDKSSQDFTFYQMINFCKYYQNLVT